MASAENYAAIPGLVFARTQSNSASRGERTVFPPGTCTTGMTPRCISRYAIAREHPSKSATSMARNRAGGLLLVLLMLTIFLLVSISRKMYSMGRKWGSERQSQKT